MDDGLRRQLHASLRLDAEGRDASFSSTTPSDCYPCAVKRALALLFASALAISAAACRTTPDPSPRRAHDGPIILITVDALRADAVGALTDGSSLDLGWSATPSLDAFFEEAQTVGWAGSAIAASSWTVPSTASLLTGLSPWQHQALRAASADLRPELTTLAEALHKLGWRTSGYTSGYWQKKRFGYSQGFDFFRGFGKGHHALGHLASLDARREFVWIHLDTPAPPFERLADETLLEAFGPLDARDQLSTSRPRLTPRDLEPYFSATRPLPEDLVRDLRALYLSDLVRLDRQIADLLEAVRSSGRWDESIVAVVGTHGEALGEAGRVLDGGQLGRETIEVPLAVKFAQAEPALTLSAESRPSSCRLWATFVELAGGRPTPAAAPSFLRRAQVPRLSELYFVGGVNQISLVEEDVQLIGTARFLADDERFFDARLASSGLTVSVPLADSPERLFRRWGRIFERTAPFGTRRDAVRWSLERWTADGPVALDDPDRENAMADRLFQAWAVGSERQLPPGRQRSRNSVSGP